MQLARDESLRPAGGRLPRTSAARIARRHGLVSLATSGMLHGTLVVAIAADAIPSWLLTALQSGRSSRASTAAIDSTVSQVEWTQEQEVEVEPLAEMPAPTPSAVPQNPAATEAATAAAQRDDVVPLPIVTVAKVAPPRQPVPRPDAQPSRLPFQQLLAEVERAQATEEADRALRRNAVERAMQQRPAGDDEESADRERANRETPLAAVPPKKGQPAEPESSPAEAAVDEARQQPAPNAPTASQQERPEDVEQAPQSKQPANSPASTASAASAEQQGAEIDELPVVASDNAPPVYPADAMQAGLEGRVLLKVTVNTDGRVQEVSVHRSSGVESLDEAAVAAVQNWRFQPARRDSFPVEATIGVPIVFELAPSADPSSLSQR